MDANLSKDAYCLLKRQNQAVVEVAAMDPERYHLVGDSSLYVKKGWNKKKPLEGSLEEMLSGPTEVTHKAGGGTRPILEAGAWVALWALIVFFVRFAGLEGSAPVPLLILWE